MTKPKRIPIGLRLRFTVFKRDAFACQYCGAHPPDTLLEVDHITPVCEGGTNDEENLITACFNCNRGKAGVPLSTAPKSLAERASIIQEREAQLAGYRQIMQARLDRIEDDAWEVAEAMFPGCSEKGTRKDWIRSIKMFNERLPLHVVVDAAEKARFRGIRPDTESFKYFCGICWRTIQEGVEE